MIGWLTERFAKLIILLDYYWFRLWELISTGLGWIVSQINAVRSWAMPVITYYFSLAQSAVLSARNWLLNQIYYYYSLALAVYEAGKSWLVNRIAYYYTLALATYEVGKSWLIGQIAYYYVQARIHADEIVNAVIGGIRSIADTALTLVNAFGSILNALKIYAELTLAGWIDRVEKTVDNLKQQIDAPISEIISDPAGTIWGVIEAYLYEFLEWWLAEQLGASTDELKTSRPPIGDSRDWKVDDFAPITNGDFIWPTPSRFISGYRWLSHPTHYGLDIALSMGTPVKAVMRGTVTRANYDAGGYGYYVDIEHPGGWWTRYAHLSKLLVSAGKSVNQGDIIGLGGSTGHSTGAHLHFEVKKNGSYVNPESVLP